MILSTACINLNAMINYTDTIIDIIVSLHSFEIQCILLKSVSTYRKLSVLLTNNFEQMLTTCRGKTLQEY